MVVLFCCFDWIGLAFILFCKHTEKEGERERETIIAERIFCYLFNTARLNGVFSSLKTLSCLLSSVLFIVLCSLLMRCYTICWSISFHRVLVVYAFSKLWQHLVHLVFVAPLPPSAATALILYLSVYISVVFIHLILIIFFVSVAMRSYCFECNLFLGSRNFSCSLINDCFMCAKNDVKCLIKTIIGTCYVCVRVYLYGDSHRMGFLCVSK